jgi:Zn-dependent M16 (insulinase) family peptidase
MSSFDPSLGLLSFLSYRDPHIVETLKVYKNTRSYYAENEISQSDMEKAIISVIGMLDKPMDPLGRGYASLIRGFAAITDDLRQNFRENILAATPQKLKETMHTYFSEAIKSSAIAVYSAQEMLDEANKQLDEKLLIENLLDT